MLGILDRIYAKKKEGLTHEDVDWHPTIKNENSSNESWYCFVPKVVVKEKRLGKGIFPNKGKIVTYVISSLNLVVPDTEQFMNNLREIYDDAMRKVEEDVKQGKSINLIGISLGGCISFKIASSLHNKRVKNLVSLVGGGD